MGGGEPFCLFHFNMLTEFIHEFRTDESTRIGPKELPVLIRNRPSHRNVITHLKWATCSLTYLFCSAHPLLFHSAMLAMQKFAPLVCSAYSLCLLHLLTLIACSTCLLHLLSLLAYLPTCSICLLAHSLIGTSSAWQLDASQCVMDGQTDGQMDGPTNQWMD